MNAREEILGRVRLALADRPGSPEIDWEYGRPVSTGGLGLVERFAERVADYHAEVEMLDREDIGPAIAAALGDARHVVGDRTLRESWPSGAELEWLDASDLTSAELDQVDAVVTTATIGIANTGTIVLDHGRGQGRRAASLVPDVHVCLISADQIVSDVPEAVARIIELGAQTHPLTWISGPSATSDIELSRVEGVHGPRTLRVIVVR
ncbi:lactate utilization protein C [Aeromicrobium sp. PE09-221]|uniref:LutC/YkgG family protein n=1 Tax=Aeromicrobium sp. PE09-221 TaxID=1898043 RepID=UPI000B3E7C21|nr:LUD domain-containing protein [Aeromicrobium sp. PE09-221]OUZ07673.1 lactate utilization protein C [Aeromicrobium sp. PE09-221]